jgi:putative flippase GtrA
MKPTELPASAPGEHGALAGVQAEPSAVNRASGERHSAGAEKVFWQAGLFALVGVANTVLDFAVYNALTAKLVGWPRIPANVVSTSAAMAFSFVVNLLWVFSPDRSLVPRRAFRFIWVTSCALYGVQNLVIWLTSDIWSEPFEQIAAQCAQAFSLGAGNEDLVARNLVKGLATIASLTWNYSWYRFYVFRNS